MNDRPASRRNRTVPQLLLQSVLGPGTPILSARMRNIGILFIALFFSVLIACLVAGPAAAQDPDSTAAADSLLIRELTREMAVADTPESAAGGDVARAAATTNPDISVIGDARARYLSEGEKNMDVGLNEAEFAFRSVIDPYARADFYISIHDTGFGHNEHGEEESAGGGENPAEEEAGHEAGFAFELEEAYLTTLSLPGRIQGRIGKFRTQIGRINTVHPHALPFIDMPAVYENFFGEEGLNDQGADLSWLLPHDAFYQELTVTVHRGPSENGSFARSEDNRLLYAAHLRNFWDLSRDATLEVGLTGLSGLNDEHERSLVGGVDVTYIWKPVQFNTYRSLTLQSELFVSRRSTAAGVEVDAVGMYSMASWQLARRWFITGRYDFSELPDDASWDQNGFSATLGWYLTEFQKLELGGTHVWGDSVEASWSALFRLVFVIGTHGAHEY